MTAFQTVVRFILERILIYIYKVHWQNKDLNVFLSLQRRFIRQHATKYISDKSKLKTIIYISFPEQFVYCLSPLAISSGFRR